MNLNKIKEIASHLMKNRKAHLKREIGGILYHGERTARIALKLRELLLPNDSSHDDILKVAAWFHDCGKGIEPHAKYGATITREALKGHVTNGDLEKICNLISHHTSRCPENNNLDDYIKIHQDADLLDHFGTYGIWMSMQYSAHIEESIVDLLYLYKKDFDDYVLKYRNQFNYNISRIIYDEKVLFEKKFIERLNFEGTGEIYNLESLIKQTLN